MPRCTLLLVNALIFDHGIKPKSLHIQYPVHSSEHAANAPVEHVSSATDSMHHAATSLLLTKPRFAPTAPLLTSTEIDPGPLCNAMELHGLRGKTAAPFARAVG